MNGECRTVGRVTAFETLTGSRRRQERLQRIACVATSQWEPVRHPPTCERSVQSFPESGRTGHSNDSAHASDQSSSAHAFNLAHERGQLVSIQAALSSEHSPFSALYQQFSSVSGDSDACFALAQLTAHSRSTSDLHAPTPPVSSRVQAAESTSCGMDEHALAQLANIQTTFTPHSPCRGQRRGENRAQTTQSDMDGAHGFGPEHAVVRLRV